MSYEIIAIESPVTDYIYLEANANRLLRDLFFQFVKPERPPRKGENILIPVEKWREHLLAFAGLHGIEIGGGTPEEQALHVRDQIFGAPIAIKAGGALANTFDTLVKSTIDGNNLADGIFVTAVGAGPSGQVFAESLPGKLLSPPPQRHQMEAHIFPIDDDRIIVAIPSFDNPSSKAMSTAQLDEAAPDAKTKMAALGGYMFYEGLYQTFFDKLKAKVAQVSDDPCHRPTIVLTAAAQPIAEQAAVRHAIAEAVATAPTLVLANTGEFRRLMDMDTEWRTPHERKWWFNAGGECLADRADVVSDPTIDTGVKELTDLGWKKLEGEDLEKRKQADAPYMNDKLAANRAAFDYGYARFCEDAAWPVTFAITNGKRDVHVIDNNGISPPYRVPKPPRVVNTVGGGDGFAAGFLLGHLRGLAQDECVTLGLACAGIIVGQDEARLEERTTQFTVDARTITATGLPAYLDPQSLAQMSILAKLAAHDESFPLEIERRFLVAGDGWKKAAGESCVIRQNYFPALQDGGIRLEITRQQTSAYISALHPDKGWLCQFSIPDQALKKFGIHNLSLIMTADGLVPVGETLEARVRSKDGVYYLGIKSDTGEAISRNELDFPIAFGIANILLPHCHAEIVKSRHIVKHADNSWEVNVFDDANAGLVTAEIELPQADLDIAMPSWLGEEVTQDLQYLSRNLASHPYPEWAPRPA